MLYGVRVVEAVDGLVSSALLRLQLGSTNIDCFLPSVHHRAIALWHVSCTFS